jgi:hypothetical protein
MLVQVDFWSNRRQFDANLDEISEEPRSAGAKLRAARSVSLAADDAGGTAAWLVHQHGRRGRGR